MAPKSKKCVFLGYGEPGEMGYRLWDPEARKIVRSNDVFFNEDKMHKKPAKIVEIRRVIFEEDGYLHRGVQNAKCRVSRTKCSPCTRRSYRR